MQPHPLLLQILPTALLPVDQNNGIRDAKPGGPERRGRLEHRGAAGDEVLDDEAVLAGAEGTFDGFGGAVVFYLLAAHEHGDVGGEGEGGGDGEGGVGDAAEEVVRGEREGREGEEDGGDMAEERRVGDEEAEVDVDWGGDAGFELESSKLYCFDLVELQN